MKLLDYDYDEGVNVITFEMKNSEISSICHSLESLLSFEGSEKDKQNIQNLHDSLLKVISIYSYVEPLPEPKNNLWVLDSQQSESR